MLKQIKASEVKPGNKLLMGDTFKLITACHTEPHGKTWFSVEGFEMDSASPDMLVWVKIDEVIKRDFLEKALTLVKD